MFVHFQLELRNKFMATRKGEKILIIMFSRENPEKKKENCNLWLFDALAEVAGRTLWGSSKCHRNRRKFPGLLFEENKL